MKNIKHYINRLLFILLSTAAMVFFSEKAFWYVQGYPILELVLYYAIPVSVCLWVIDLFQVQRLSGMVLIGALYGFIVEGVLTPVAYEAGLLDPVMPAYFVGWHGLLGMVFGWYLIRKWLVEGQTKLILLTGSAFGIFWGLWSLPYRLPESIHEFEIYNQAGDSWLPGAWPVDEYLFYTLVFTLILMIAHWLLGKGSWQREFKMKGWEIGIVIALLGFIFAFTVYPVEPLAILKLTTMIALVILPLRINRLQRDEASILNTLEGRLEFSQTLPLLVIPVFATLVYALAEVFPPSEEMLRTIYEGFSIIQALIGAGFFIWAWVDSVRKLQ